jgi:hypothetical protein
MTNQGKLWLLKLEDKTSGMARSKTNRKQGWPAGRTEEAGTSNFPGRLSVRDLFVSRKNSDRNIAQNFWFMNQNFRS